ncbi:MAG: ATP-binding cassette domain-containing protein [Hellea sp.]
MSLDSETIAKPSSELLSLYFRKLEIPINIGALSHEYEKLSAAKTNCDITEFIVTLCKNINLDSVRVAKFRFKRFDLRRLPALIYFQKEWFVVHSSLETSHVQLTDPFGNTKEVNIDLLQTSDVLWFAVQTKEKQQNQPKKNIALNFVLKALFKSKAWVWHVGIATIVVNLLGITTSIFAMQTYDRVVPTLAYTTLTTLVVGMIIVVSTDWILKTIRARILDTHGAMVNTLLSKSVFDHLMRLQLDKRPKSLGSLSAQITGLDSVRQFFSSAFIFYLIDLPFALMFIFFIYIIGGPVAFVYLSLLPAAAFLSLLAHMKLRKVLKEQMIRSHERQGLLVDTIKGAESIRATNASWRFTEQWNQISDSIDEYSLKNKTISSFVLTSTGSLSTLAYIAAIVVGVTQIESGTLTMGGLIACSILGGRVISPIAQGVQQIVQWQNVSQSLDMVDNLLNIETERHPTHNLLFPQQAPEKINLNKVKFSYGDKPITQLDINNLTFNAGDRVVLIGPIGSGKSTLLKVLAGMYKPTAGRIILGNADLWEIDPNVLTEYVGYLPQTVGLFKGTLLSNLALSGATDDSYLLEIVNELGINQIAADSSQQMGLVITEGGEGLSEGQKQLVGIARIFLAQPKVWLLDEPTSSMDLDTEHRVLSAINKYIKPQDILIMSTHRPRIAAKFANRIIAMRKGEIVADDNPKEVFNQMQKNQNTPHEKTQHKP